MSNLFMSYLHILGVDARPEKKNAFKALSLAGKVQNKISVNRYWLEIYSNRVEKLFFQQRAAKKFPSTPFLTSQSWLTLHPQQQASDKKKIDPDEFMVEKLLSDL